jgi:pantoate--beta-alanine ligase
MSSRNIRLTDEERKAARVISKALTSAARESSVAQQRDVLHSVLATEKQFSLDYAEVIDGDTYEIADAASVNNRAIVAGWINGVRLLDNMVMRAVAHEVRTK